MYLHIYSNKPFIECKGMLKLVLGCTRQIDNPPQPLHTPYIITYYLLVHVGGWGLITILWPWIAFFTDSSMCPILLIGRDVEKDRGCKTRHHSPNFKFLTHSDKHIHVY